MKVLEVINSLRTIGGAETFAVDFSIELSHIAEVEVAILYDANNSYLLSRLKNAGITTHVFHKRAHIGLKTIFDLRRLIKTGHFNVVHTENNALISTFLARMGIRQKPKIFHTIHNPAPIECGGRVSGFLYRRFFKQKDVVPVAISSEMAKSANAFYKMLNCPFINNGIDLSTFNSRIPLRERQTDCAVVARLTEQKNYPFLIRVFCYVQERIPSFQAKIAGDGPLRHEIEDSIAEKGAGSFIHLLGQTQRSADLLSNTKILVLGSLYEGNPLCLLEGMASGCVIVSSAVGGIPDIVLDGTNGFLFKEYGVEAFGSKIVDILTNPNEFEPIRLGNIRASLKYSIQQTVQSYAALFQSSWRRENAKNTR